MKLLLFCLGTDDTTLPYDHNVIGIDAPAKSIKSIYMM